MIHCDGKELVITGTRVEISTDFFEILHELVTEEVVRIGGESVEFDFGRTVGNDEVVTYSKRWR